MIVDLIKKTIPDGFLALVKDLGSDCEYTLLLGDTSIDRELAKNTNCPHFTTYLGAARFDELLRIMFLTLMVRQI